MSATFLMSVYAAREQRLEEPAPTLESTEPSAEADAEIDSIIGEWTDPSQLEESPAESIEYYGFDNESADDLELLDVAGAAVDEGLFQDRDPEKMAGMFQDFGFSIRTGVQYTTGGRGGRANDGSGDVVFTISPAFSYNSGGGGPASVGVSYSPSALFYMDDSNESRLNHNFSLNAGYQFGKTSVGISAGFSLSDAGDRFLTGGGNVEDQANNTDRYFEDGTSTTSYNLGLNLSRQLTGKSSLGFGLNYSDNLFDDGNGIDRSTTSSNLSWQYQITNKINVGPYVSGEWTGVEGGGDQTSYGIGTSISYPIGAKTSLSGSIGVENRSFSGEDAVGDRAFLTYNLGIGYSLTSKVSLSTSFFRSVQPSFTEFDQATTSTGVSFGANYQITDRISTNASVNYSMDDSFSTLENTASTNENQDYLSLSLGAGWSIGDHWVLGANFSLRQNNSDNGSQDFDSMVTGVSATFDF